MSNEELKNNMIETADWALNFVSETKEEINAKTVTEVLDSTSKLISQVNEMSKIEAEAKEKEATRLQQAEIEKAKLEAEKEFNKQKLKTEKRRTWIDIAKVAGTVIGSALSFYAYSQLFKMHKNDEFMTGTEKDAFNQVNKIDKRF